MSSTIRNHPASRSACRANRQPGKRPQHGYVARRYRSQGQHKGRLPYLGTRQKQRADVEPCSAQHRMKCIAFTNVEPAPVHPVVGHGVTDQRFDGFTPLKPSLLLRREQFVLAAVEELYRRQLFAHASIAQVHDGRDRLDAENLQQRVGLLGQGSQGVTVIRIAGEAAHAHDQAALMCDLQTELLGLTGLALADAFGLRRMQGVELGLVLGQLATIALVALHRGVQPRSGIVDQAIQLAPHLARESAQDRALALEHRAQSLELLDIVTCTSVQRPAVALVGLLQLDTAAFDHAGHLLACHLQQPPVGGGRDGLALRPGADDHALELGLLDRSHCHGRVYGGLQQLLYTGRAQHTPESADLSRVAGKAGLEIDLAAQELEVDALRPMLDEGLVALVVGVLQVEQRNHQKYGQARSTSFADTGTGHRQVGEDQVGTFDQPTFAMTVRKHRRQRAFDARPWHARGKLCHRVAQIDHLVKSSQEEVVGGHRRRSSISQESPSIRLNLRRSDHRKSPHAQSQSAKPSTDNLLHAQTLQTPDRGRARLDASRAGK